jgi:hypothetical protein
MADYTAPRYWPVRYFSVRYFGGAALGGPAYVNAELVASGGAGAATLGAVVVPKTTYQPGGGAGYGFDYIRPRRVVDARLIASGGGHMTATAIVELGRGRRARRRDEEALLLAA